MNRHAICATFVATICATLALVSATAVAGKPVPQDACATATDFPAFAYLIPASGNKPHTIYVADLTGKCSRTLIAGRSPKFSYPVPALSKTGRVVFFGGSASSIDTVDFTVGAGNTVTVGPTSSLPVIRGCCALDLSKDGQTVYFSDTDSSLAKFEFGTRQVTQIYALPPEDASWAFQQVSVNGDGKQLYATRTGNQLNSGASKLVRIDLTTTPATEIILREWPQQDGYGAQFFSPAANQYDNRVAFHEYIVGTNNCTPLVVTDMDGIPIPPAPGATARYGKFGTWVGNNVVMERRGPMDGSGKCASTTSLSQIDPTTGAETVLITGYQPNGR